MAADRGIQGVTFSSAGVGALEGSAASDGSVLVALERGIDLSNHRSQMFGPSLVQPDTIVLTMTTSHLSSVRSLVPDVKAYLLDDYASYGAHKRPVSDPFGGDLSGYREAADDIESMLVGVLDRLVAERASGSR
jgi:protein-tyrosine phosphatase